MPCRAYKNNVVGFLLSVLHGVCNGKLISFGVDEKLVCIDASLATWSSDRN